VWEEVSLTFLLKLKANWAKDWATPFAFLLTTGNNSTKMWIAWPVQRLCSQVMCDWRQVHWLCNKQFAIRFKNNLPSLGTYSQSASNPHLYSKPHLLNDMFEMRCLLIVLSLINYLKKINQTKLIVDKLLIDTVKNYHIKPKN